MATPLRSRIHAYFCNTNRGNVYVFPCNYIAKFNSAVTVVIQIAMIRGLPRLARFGLSFVLPVPVYVPRGPTATRMSVLCVAFRVTLASREANQASVCIKC